LTEHFVEPTLEITTITILLSIDPTRTPTRCTARVLTLTRPALGSLLTLTILVPPDVMVEVGTP
jgi:hypothetical protein